MSSGADSAGSSTNKIAPLAQNSRSLRGGKLGGSIVLLLVVSCLSTGLLAFGTAGLIHSYAHVSLQALGKVGSWIGSVGNASHSLGLWGIEVAGVGSVVAVALGSAIIHYARKPQLTEELLKVFSNRAEKLGLSEKNIDDTGSIKRGHYEIYDGDLSTIKDEHYIEYFLVVRTNALSREVKYTGWMPKEESDKLADQLCELGFK